VTRSRPITMRLSTVLCNMMKVLFQCNAITPTVPRRHIFWLIAAQQPMNPTTVMVAPTAIKMYAPVNWYLNVASAWSMKLSKALFDD